MATSVTLKPNAIDISGSTSGTTTLQASAVAGTTTLTLPAATDTLVGKATTDTLTNKTLTGAAMNGTLGATTPSTASVTTLTTSSTVTHSGGTANGVAYLDGSKVLTTGSALVFDGSNLGIANTSMTSFYNGGRQLVVGSGSGSQGMSIYAGSANDSGIYFARGLTGNDPFQGQLVYSHNVDAMRFYTAATERMRLDSAGNFGIGTSSPQIQSWRAGTYLTVANVSTRGQIEIDGAVADSGSASLGALIFTYSTNTTNHKDVALIEATSSGATANQRGGVLNFYTKANGTASPALNMTLDSSGNLLVGTTTAQGNTSTFAVDGNVKPVLAINNTNSISQSDQSIRFVRNGSTVGTISTTLSATAYNTSSDYRLKNTIAPMTGSLAKVAALKPVTYKWDVDGSDGEGFIAHELAEVCPSAVTGEKDAVDADGNPVYQGIDTSFLVATLTAAIQEQQAIIQSLTARITALESA